jgi:hypothetical protein
MKKLINDAETVVDEMLDGMVAAYPDSVRRLPDTQVLVRDDAPGDDKVAVVSGGGSGHEPTHAGYLGEGMLDGAAAGEVFTSPTADELEALRTFEEQIRAIPTEDVTFETGQPVALVGTAVESTTGLGRVREAYESTLMSVPHYLEEYDDTYTESLAAEFSPDIASTLTDGTRFNDRRKRAVLSAVANAQSTRELLLDTIDREETSIREAKAEFEPLITDCEEIRQIQFDEEEFGALDAYRTRLQVLSEKCRTLSERRQGAIFDQRRIQRLPTDAPDTATYVYQDLDVDYPVLSLVVEVLDGLTTCRRRIEHSMSYYHA